MGLPDLDPSPSGFPPRERWPRPPGPSPPPCQARAPGQPRVASRGCQLWIAAPTVLPLPGRQRGEGAGQVPSVPRSIPVPQRSPCPGTPAAREPELGPRPGGGAAWHTLGPAGETGKVGPGLSLGVTLLRPAAGSHRIAGRTRAEQAREEAGPLVSAS